MRQRMMCTVVCLVICCLCCILLVDAHDDHQHSSDDDEDTHVHDIRRTNCNISYECSKCKEGEYKIIKIGERSMKVCCPNCSKYFQAGNKRVGTDSIPFCSCYTPEEIQGDCWKGEECQVCQQEESFKEYVGIINSIPVCCKNCEKSGLALGLKLCECLHNGP